MNSVISSNIFLIGPAHALPSLTERLDLGPDLQTFSENDALDALESLIKVKPRIVALEETFAASARGKALIHRINDDKSLHSCEIRIVAQVPIASASETAAAKAARADTLVAKAVGPKRNLHDDPRGTRRAERIIIRDGVDVLVDSKAARLLDVSLVGLQVMSATALKPSQRVRVTLTEQNANGRGPAPIRCEGLVVWASYELPKGEAPRYRAGIDLTNVDPMALRTYAERHRAPD